jgi:cell wall assembly regulator SMI1
MRPPASDEAIKAVQQHIPVALPTDLCTWWSICDGFTSGTLVALMPYIHTPVPTYKAVELRRECLEIWTVAGEPDEDEDDHEDQDDHEDEQSDEEWQAGAFSFTYREVFVPIAEDHCGDHLFVDLRPGPMHGCVSHWNHDQAFLDQPMWHSVAGMLADVASSMLTGTPVLLDHAQRWAAAGHLMAVTRMPSVNPNGELVWLEPFVT